jgi:rhomboid protease GluP
MAAQRPSIRYSTEGLSRAEVIVLLFQAFRTLNWGVEHLHPMRVVAKTPATGFAKGEDVVIELDDHGFSALSKPSEWSPFARKGRHQINLEKLMDAFAEARVSTPPEAMAADLHELEASGVMRQDASSAHANEFKWSDIGSVLIPGRALFATPVLLDISLVVYIVMVATGVHFFSPSGEDLLAWGGNYRSATMSGEWWRLLTSCFVHIGIVHLLFNMYALLMVGLQLEPLLGRWRVLALYVVTGLCASVASLWWHDNTVSAGASGAIFGLYGVFLALLFTDLIHKEVRQQLLSSIGVFVVFNLLYGMKGGIDNAAHIGGLVSGVVLGFALYPSLRHPERPALRWAGLVLPILVLTAGAVAAVRSLPADDSEYVERMKAFERWEQEGSAMFELGESATGDHQLVVLEERSAPAWDSALVLLEGTLQLDLSPAVAERRDRLMDYVRERQHNTRLIQQALQDPLQDRSAAIDSSFARIDSMLTGMQ